MANINLTEVISTCTNFWNTVFSQDGLVKNSDGTLSVYVLNSNNIKSPHQVTKTCCETLNTMTGEGYYYDLDTQKCRWSVTNIVGVDEKPFKIVLNPNGDDGSMFNVDEDGTENCSLLVDFDYLLKFDCEKLSTLISPTIPIDSAVLAVIKGLETQIDDENLTLENILSDLDIYNSELDALTYSIVCDSFPIQDTTFITPIQKDINPTAKQIVPFNKTAFGSVAPFSFAAMTTKEVTYCLTEPNGLEVWGNILGNRFQRFLNADPDSYTCEDVIAIYNYQSPDILIYECVTPFGAKTLVQNKVNLLKIQETESRAKIIDLQTQLNIIGRTEANSCSNPIRMLETMDVSVSIDVIEDNGSLTSVYNDNIFPMIGLGNLYEYLAEKGDNSGLFLCGTPNSSETWAEGCIGLNFSASTNETNVNSCINIHDYFLNELYIESGYKDVEGGLTAFTTSLTPNVLSSDWLHYSMLITDESVINIIKNKKIKLSIGINSSCGNFCILVDNISLDKNCETVKRNDIIVSKSPGFNLNRVIDNKKSWVNNDSLDNRFFNINNINSGADIRHTNYNINDERLIINTKEIDLDINISKAVEYDVLTFIIDNPCLLNQICTPCVIDTKTFQDGIFFKFQDGYQYDFQDINTSEFNDCCIEDCNPCVDNDKEFQDDECFNFMDNDEYDFQDGSDSDEISDKCCGDRTQYLNLLTTDLNTIITVDMFETVISSELIDAKNRQTISSYPTLKALYERYLNSSEYCGVNSSSFNYTNIDQFAGLIGDYWVDIIEQVIPATTIWGSVRVYTNTIFDQQKLKYKAYSSLFCDNPFPELKAVKGINCKSDEIEVITSVITQVDENGIPSKPIYTKCNKIYMVQMNSGSEFIGTINLFNNNENNKNSVTEVIL